MKNWRSVTKEVFDAAVASYQQPLVRDVARMCEPALLSYNDFSGGKVWPESMVAKVVLWESEHGRPGMEDRANEYFLPPLPKEPA